MKLFFKVMMFVFVSAPSFVLGAEKKGGEIDVTYKMICGHCHEVGVGTQILGRKLPVEYTSYIVRHGFRAMPPFPATHVSDAELKAVAEFIESAPAQLDHKAEEEK